MDLERYFELRTILQRWRMTLAESIRRRVEASPRLARQAERCAFWSSDQDQKQVTCAVNHRIGLLACKIPVSQVPQNTMIDRQGPPATIAGCVQQRLRVRRYPGIIGSINR